MWIADKRAARKLEVLNLVRSECQRGRGLAWLSRRLLCKKKLFRSNAETMSIVKELVEDGKLCRVSAPGRGRGLGRTLYWMPATSKKKVLGALKREQMPERAFVHALRFFVRPENGPDGDRQQPLRVSPSGLNKKKDARARAKPGLTPSEPPRPPPAHPAGTPSTPPSDGRLARHGSNRAAAERLHDGQISEALTRMRRHVKSTADNSRKASDLSAGYP